MRVKRSANAMDSPLIDAVFNAKKSLKSPVPQAFSRIAFDELFDELGMRSVKMEDLTSNPAKTIPKQRKEPAFLQVLMELMAGFEPATSSLPMVTV